MKQEKLGFDFLRDAWRRSCNIPPEKPKHIPTWEELTQSQWSTDFEEMMRNRLIMGYFRYGHLYNQPKGQYDVLASMRRRIELYEETGNDELLVDIANLCIVEYVTGVHPLKHFNAVDDGEHVKKK